MADRVAVRGRLYESYAAQHAGRASGRAAALIYRRDIRPALPAPGSGPVVDIGCGQGALVALMLADGHDAAGVDISPEQVALARLAGRDRVHHGDYLEFLSQREGRLAAVTATDLLEHLTSGEVLATLDAVRSALVPGGVLVARVPNAVSPLGGHVRYGDFTHESWFTVRSVRQIAAAAGFVAVTATPCPPVAHGLVSTARAALWKPISAGYKLALAVETGALRGHIVTQNLTFRARTAS